MLSNGSLLAVAIIAAAVGVGLLRRTYAAAAILLANLLVFFVMEAMPYIPGLGPPTAPIGGPAAGSYFGEAPTIQAELALANLNLQHLSPLALLQLVTNLFVHHDAFHLLGNLFVLAAFGLPFEQRIGSRRFLAIYLAGGVLASLAQVAVEWGHPILLMGASGAIFAVLAAFAARFPNQVIPVPLVFIVLPMRVFLGALFYIGFQVVYLTLQRDQPGLGGTAYYAHLGGAVAGVLLALAILRPEAVKSPVAVDLRALEPFARDAKTRQVWDHLLTNHDEPAVFQAWLDRFFRSATCPSCGHRVAPRPRGEVVCTQNHTFDVRKGAAAAAPPAPPAREG